MRVSLVQVDGKMPNLALMKLSAFHKAQGDTVGLNLAGPELIYVSCVFSKNLSQAQGIGTFYPNAKVILGGPGLMTPNNLPDYVDHLMPDYSLYDIKYSIGFTSRGCINECGFCIVPLLEGMFREYAEIKEFHHPDHKKLILLDNNILASKILDKKLDYIQDNDLKVSFCQGLDARLVTPKIAARLAEIKSYNFHFTKRFYYFAWDFIENEDRVLRGLQYMLDAGISPRKLMVYVLVGYNTTHEQDWYRYHKLRDLEVDPFIMKYNGRTDDKFLNHLARWVNKRIYKSCEFHEYKPLSPTLQMEVENYESSS